MSTLQSQLDQLEKDVVHLMFVAAFSELTCRTIVDKFATIRAAVGGEAVAWITPNALSVLRDPSNENYSVYAEIYDTRFIEACNNITTESMIPLYASPPATVDVVALRGLVDKLRTRGPASPMTFNIGTATVSKTPYEVGLAERKLIADELAVLIGTTKGST